MRVAVTGCTGSFGRAFIKHVLSHELAERLVGVSRDELKQSELMAAYPDDPAPLRLVLGDVRDRSRLEQAFYGCDTVVHAAALKRVDAVSYNPGEVVKTNVVGTENVVNAALAAGVTRLVFISSDKAVAPLNIYGASKALAEQIVVSANTYTYPRGLRCAVVRYGNVLGSRGSVVHRWRDQVAMGIPLMLTDARMTRFIITLSAAVRYVLDVLDRIEGGEIFVPVLPSVRLMDLAAAIGGDGYPIAYVGLRPGGEKLQEALLSDDEPTRTRYLAADRALYAVAPSVCTWRDACAGWLGTPVDPALRYVSDGGHGWLSAVDLRILLEDT